ncbi:MAG: GAF domain-containing sensor histidine kinase [Anaerolineae bacterium]
MRSATSTPDRLGKLLARREPANVAAEALAILMRDFGARAGSLYVSRGATLRVRGGELSDATVAHLDRWEANVEKRISAGPWLIAGREGSSLAWQSVRDTHHRAAYSLILEGQRVIGTISLIYPRAGLPVGEERDALVRFLQVVGRVMSLVSELALTKQRMSQLGLFYQMAQAMASTFDLERALDDTLELATAILNATASSFLLVDEDRQQLVFAHTHGEAAAVLRGRRLALSEGIAGWVATHGEPVVVNEVADDPRFCSKVDDWTGFQTHSIVCVPVQARGKIIAVLQVLNKRNQANFDAEDLSLMITTASQAAIAIENNRLYQSLRDEKDRIIQAQENVRRQVARNLHDGTVQFLSAISMGLDHLERLLEFKPEAARSELEALRDLTRQATQEARLALFELRPLILETQGLVPALESYVQQLQDSEAFALHLQAADDLPDLRNTVAGTVFAIVQEALSNAKKHAAPRDVWLRLSQEENCLNVVIEDNGHGFDYKAVQERYDQQGSIGLLTMRERAELLNGQVEIQSLTTGPQAGTKVILSVPLLQENGAASTSSTT